MIDFWSTYSRKVHIFSRCLTFSIWQVAGLYVIFFKLKTKIAVKSINIVFALNCYFSYAVLANVFSSLFFN
ncbi:hypothetical protein CXF67_00085 [Psychroflexus sp. MES1-P1E]|nr:hypothetical protein CXF67_00085 [Psychroflexus sp. MES1-P1E]